MVKKTKADANKAQVTQPEPATSAPLTALQKLQQCLMDTYDMTELLHLSRSTLFNWRKKELLPYIRVQNKIFYHHDDVVAFLQRNKRQHKK